MAEKMKSILVICQHYWPENFRITDICEGFSENGCKVDVLCGLPNYPKGEYFSGYSYTKPRKEKHNNVEIFRAGEILRKGNTGIRIFLNYISYPFTSIFSLPRLLGRKYDAVFCYQLSPVLMLVPAILYAKLHKVPLTAYVLDLWPENLYSVLPVNNKLARSIASGVSHFLYRRADKLIALSQTQEQKLKSIAPKSKTAIIPQYCEDFYANTIDDEVLYQKYKSDFIILFTGNFSPAQDLSMLIECAQKLRAEQIENIRFVLVGDGMSKKELTAKIQSENLDNYFDLVGQKQSSEMPRYFGIASALFAALADSADLGLTVPAKIASYMAGAKPLLVAMNGEGNAAVKAAQCGLTSASGDAEGLYDNIVKLYNMPLCERKAMGDNGKKYYKEHYAREDNLHALMNFIL
ncbi:MAG: glycosyltransferase family 4 protein [Oscillospiraceae bacterium]